MIQLHKFTPHLLAVEVPEGITKFVISNAGWLCYYSHKKEIKVLNFISEEWGSHMIIGLLCDCLKDERLAEKCVERQHISLRNRFRDYSREYEYYDLVAQHSLKTRLESESLDLSKNYLIIKVL